MTFRFDAVAPIKGGNATWWYERAVAEHPIVYGLGELSTLTGCSIDLRNGAHPVMIAHQVDAGDGDYSRNSNFGEVEPQPNRPQGALVMSACASPGRGRVVAFGDSTCLSSFSYYRDQHDDFVLRSVSWLNRKQGWGQVPPFLKLAGALGIFVLTLGLVNRLVLPIAAPCFAVGVFCGWWGSVEIQGRLLRPPVRMSGVIDVGIVAVEPTVTLPPVLGTFGESTPGTNLSTFIQIPQRFGFATRLIRALPSSLEELEILLILNPQGTPAHFDSAWIAAVREWVSKGGRLLVTQLRTQELNGDDGKTVYFHGTRVGRVDGLQSDLVASSQSIGRGSATLIGPAESLDVLALGHCMSVPDKMQMARWKDIYAIFEDIIQVPRIDRRTYIP